MTSEPTLAEQQNKEPDARKTKNLGPLNTLLFEGLPDFHHEDGILDTHKLASALGISFQALYKIYSRDRIPAKRIGPIVQLSENSVIRPYGFTPLNYESFKDFI